VPVSSPVTSCPSTAASSPAAPERLHTARRTDTPYVNIKITREGGTTPAQKAELIKGVTDLLVGVLDKSPATTFVVIDEVDREDWGVGGLPVEEYRKRAK
jgi:4-oxalocrotonate tautomerase